jgi:two-component system, chemotaxis family, chemotaxis protein CheY
MSAGGSESQGRDLASMPKRRPHRILVVDDDADILDALADALTDEGYTVASAKDGLEALSYLGEAAAAPCLILLDWMMPRCDGPTFRKRQLADVTLSSIPVVLLTADPRVQEKSREIGAVAHLRKPIDLDELLRIIERHC